MGLRDKLSKAIVSRAAKKAERASTSESNTSKSESRSLLKQILSRDKNSSDISDEEESDHENESVEGTEFSKAKDKNFGMKKYVDADKPGTWNVLIRAIEARDVDSGALRVRAICDGRQKTTRAVTHIAPKWKQNLLFTMKNETLEKLSAKIVGLKVTRATRFGETVVGEFSCYFSAIVHASDRAIIAKWVALTLPNDNDDQDHVVYENCGFLKLSICIYRIDETPPQLVDDDGTEEVWSGAQIVDYTLKIRIFRLCRISEHIVNAVNQLKSKKKLQFFISVQCGNQKTDTSFEPLLDEEENDAEVRFEQELYLPIQWPTVLSKISLALYMKRGRKKRCIGQASIPLRSIYEPGESGFMPTFGPTFINFFGLETLLKLKWLREKKTVDEEEGSKYLARLLVAVDCVEHMGESTARSFLDHSSLRQATLFENYHEKYVLCCSLQSCNMINPLFASDSIQFFASIATYGSTGPEKRENSSSSLGAMPNPDGCKYFVMPWGNCLPTMEIKGLFENVDARMERTNALMKVEELLR